MNFLTNPVDQRAKVAQVLSIRYIVKMAPSALLKKEAAAKLVNTESLRNLACSLERGAYLVGKVGALTE